MEILKGIFDEWEYDKENMELKKKRSYHIYLRDKTIIIEGSFPVKYMAKLRQLIRDIDYDNLMIGDPWI